jgi:hypothetical protein
LRTKTVVNKEIGIVRTNFEKIKFITPPSSVQPESFHTGFCYYGHAILASICAQSGEHSLGDYFIDVNQVIGIAPNAARAAYLLGQLREALEDIVR